MQKLWMILIIAALLVAACAPLTSSGDAPDASQAETAPPAAEDAAAPLLSSDETPPPGAESQFSTDFSNHTIPYSEVLSGGPPKDGIPAIDAPAYATIEEADAWLADAEAVVVVELEGAVRAYPVQILMWHEIVNDMLGGRGLSVTYCPLCNTAIAFSREFEGQLLDFGTTGRLRFSNLIMYDRQSETWWQQATGEGIAGEYAGSELTGIPAFLVSWADFKRDFPDGDVLSRQTGFQRNYGANPYPGYDTEYNDPFLYQGPETPDALPPLSRVLTIDRDEETVAFPYALLETERVINETVAGLPVVVFWQPGTASALDRAAVGEGRDVGSATSYAREMDGRVFSFEPDGANFRDLETRSTWNHFGQAVDGELAGSALEPVLSINHFWFSWAAFRPETRIIGMQGENGSLPTGSNLGESASSAFAGAPDLPLDFLVSLYQGFDDADRSTLQFSELFTDGKPVVAMFFAGLCPFCRADLAVLQDAFENSKDAVHFIAIDIGPYTNLGSETDGKALLADLSVTLPAGSLTEPSVLSTYRVLGTPAFLFFNAEGQLMRSWVGSVKAAQLKSFLSEIL